jgi:TonB family protein
VKGSKYFLVSSIAIVVLSICATGQTFPTVEKFIEPLYPPAAVAVRAEGEVQVSVEIDDLGKVISAEAITGHALLRAAAGGAARKWSFTPLPGRHFLILRFVFRLGDYVHGRSAQLVGTFTLDNIEPRYKLVQTVNYAEGTIGRE